MVFHWCPRCRLTLLKAKAEFALVSITLSSNRDSQGFLGLGWDFVCKISKQSSVGVGGFCALSGGFFFFLPSYCDRCIKEEVGMTELGMGLSWVGCGGCRGCIAWVWSSGFCGFFFFFFWWPMHKGRGEYGWIVYGLILMVAALSFFVSMVELTLKRKKKIKYFFKYWWVVVLGLGWWWVNEKEGKRTEMKREERERFFILFYCIIYIILICCIVK